MSIERLKQLLTQSENIRLEFKEAAIDLPKNLFETVCAMLNRDGGNIILGADDNGFVTGIPFPQITTMVTNLVNLSNNPQKLDPPFILFPQTYQIADKWLIYLQVPASSQVHKTNGHFYDRSHDGDFKLNQPHQIAQIYNRKRTHYTENIYPCSFIIYHDHVETQNANNPHGTGPINPNDFTPFPKNPTLVKFFIQLGWAEELGSGVLNITRLMKKYASKGIPQFIEDNIFKTTIPLPDRVAMIENAGLNAGLKIIVEWIADHPGNQYQELATALNRSPRTLERQIKKLTELNIIQRIGSKKTGGYYVVKSNNS